MCYLVAKKFDEIGCVALKARHGKELVKFTKSLDLKIGEKGIQLVTISKPEAYGEYAPYKLVETKEDFIKYVEN